MRLSSTKVMNKSRLSRSRFLVDASFMLLWRERLTAALSSPHGSAFFLMTDSSPQFNRDYQVTLLRKVDRVNMPQMLRASTELFHLWSGTRLSNKGEGCR